MSDELKPRQKFICLLEVAAARYSRNREWNAARQAVLDAYDENRRSPTGGQEAVHWIRVIELAAEHELNGNVLLRVLEQLGIAVNMEAKESGK